MVGRRVYLSATCHGEERAGAWGAMKPFAQDTSARLQIRNVRDACGYTVSSLYRYYTHWGG